MTNLELFPVIILFAFQVYRMVSGCVCKIGFVSQINVAPCPTLINKRIQQPTDGTDHQGSQNGRPESMNVKTGNEAGCHLQHQGVDYKGKKTQGQNIDWKGDKKCDGSK